ncbi:MAG: leucine-rich repeat domain-containing protein, partial [Candidatus Methanomethylophilaceae archaeon]|nr:leucine-rich repeat domain-containing protein [Candidatus Methanomethylophilaceae archaeon]
GFKYKVTSKNTVALIRCSDALIESLIVPESVRHLGFDYTVTKIGTKAFYKFTNLKSVDLGCVDSIGIKAFAYCSSIEAIDLSDVREICPYAFYCCGSLKTLKLEDGTSVGAYAFYKCKGLESIEFGTIPSIESNSFYGWVFWDPVTGKRLTVNADSLSNSLFEKVASKMVRS